ncbi:hypothetical protein ACEQPO_26675 [Bacillus sp. SL00103]
MKQYLVKPLTKVSIAAIRTALRQRFSRRRLSGRRWRLGKAIKVA